MADFPLIDSSRYASAGTAALSTGGTVTAGVANTKGVYAQIVPSLQFDTNEIWIKTKIHRLIPFSKYILYDVAIGTPGAEVDILSNICISGVDSQSGHMIHLPFGISKGTSISCRTQSNGAGAVISVSFIICSHGFANFSSRSRMKSYGGNATNSHATVVSPGGVANTKGSWAQLTASTTDAISEIVLVTNDEAAADMGAQDYLMDIGMGPAGQEKIIINDLYLSGISPASMLTPRTIGPLPVSIPAGSRIAARVQCTNSNTLQSDIGLVVIGLSS